MLKRGRSLAPAALLLLCLASLSSRAPAQAARLRDAGFAFIEYDNGLQVGAMSLNESVVLERLRSRTSADGVLSIFSDGSWSMAGALQGSSFSQAVPLAPRFAPLFRSMRGEMSVGAFTTAQRGQQPTLQLQTEARAHFIDLERGFWIGGGVARVFDGAQWRTTIIADGTGWYRRGSALFTVTARPYQLAYGDLLGDTEATMEWTRGRATWGATAGLRLGEALRGTVGWLGLSLTLPGWRGMLTTASVGSYPVDLLQGLPGGRYMSVTMRLPTRRRALPPPVPITLRPEDVPDTPVSAGVVLFSLAPGQTERQERVVHVRTSGAERVEVMGDFTDWEPVQLRRTPTGIWEVSLRVPPGRHRFLVRVDGGEWKVPNNVVRVRDDFDRSVGTIVVP